MWYYTEQCNRGSEVERLGFVFFSFSFVSTKCEMKAVREPGAKVLNVFVIRNHLRSMAKYVLFLSFGYTRIVYRNFEIPFEKMATSIAYNQRVPGLVSTAGRSYSNLHYTLQKPHRTLSSSQSDMILHISVKIISNFIHSGTMSWEFRR